MIEFEFSRLKKVLNRVGQSQYHNIIIVITFFFAKLPWLGDSEGTFRSSSQAATRPPVHRLHTMEALNVALIAERQAGKL